MYRAILLSLLLTGCAYSEGVDGSYYRVGVPGFGFFGPGSSRPAPEMAPERQVSEQDCSRPVDFTAGNLSCK